MSEQEKNDKESMICLTVKPSQSFFVYFIQSKENIFTEKELLNEKVWMVENWTKNEKKAF